MQPFVESLSLFKEEWVEFANNSCFKVREMTIMELLYSDKQNVCTTYTVVVYCINVLIKQVKNISVCNLLIQNH